MWAYQYPSFLLVSAILRYTHTRDGGAHRQSLGLKSHCTLDPNNEATGTRSASDSGVFLQQHRPLSAVSQCLPLWRSLCLLYLQAIIDKKIGRNMLVNAHDFEMTTTAHCSVPMSKRPSDKASPSD